MSPHYFVFQALIETKNNYMAVSERGEKFLCVVHNTFPFQRQVQGSTWCSVKYVNDLMLSLTEFFDSAFSKGASVCILRMVRWFCKAVSTWNSCPLWWTFVDSDPELDRIHVCEAIWLVWDLNPIELQTLASGKQLYNYLSISLSSLISKINPGMTYVVQQICICTLDLI